MRYFKNLLSDLRSGRLALHPILLAATFCITKLLAINLIVILGDYKSYAAFSGNFIVWDIMACACFMAIGAHLVYVAGRSDKSDQTHRLYRLTVLWVILRNLCVSAYIVGCLIVSMDDQEIIALNLLVYIVLASAIIYLIAIRIFIAHSVILVWCGIYVLSYVAAAFMLFIELLYCSFENVNDGVWYLSWKGLEIIFPLIWAFYFKRTYKKPLAEEMREA